ncbi:MAG: Helix-turn-helix domain [Firmicutes bacterium]|nr:Helix-turn-helix domain [Bacillota bacterium]
MHSRLKQLRLGFGVDQAAMATLLGVTPLEWGGWEAGAALPSAEATAAMASRLGLSTDWLRGAAVPMWGERLLAVRESVDQRLRKLSGMQLITVVSATTGERIAYVLRLLQEAAPDLFTPAYIAGWLGLSMGSTELLLKDALDPGTPVVMRAADLTGVSEDWFRMGPVVGLPEDAEGGGA